jgi:hypothetical protein
VVPVVSTSAPVQALLKTITFKGIKGEKSFQDALDDLAQENHVAFQIDDRAFFAEGIKPEALAKTDLGKDGDISPMKGTLGRVLRVLLTRIPAPSGATFMVRPDHIEITTGKFQNAQINTTRPEIDPLRKKRVQVPALSANTAIGLPGNPPQTVCIDPEADDSDQPRTIQVALVSLSLDKQPIAEAARQIRLQSNLNVVLDPALDDKKVQMPLTVTLLNNPADSAVQVLAEMADLDVVWTDNTFFVTSKEKAERLNKKWPNRRAGGALPVSGGDAGAAM